jgi:hypothetical protein
MEEGNLNIHNLQDVGINAMQLISSVICMPVEMVIRPSSGSRYYPPGVVFLTTILMLFLPVFSMGVSMIPFIGGNPPSGIFDLGSLSKLYFFLSFAHGVRVYRLMAHPEREEFSWYEGPPLFFIKMIPGSKSFWVTRMAIEPVLVFLTASVLNSLFIFQSGLTAYIHVAAVALAFKQFTHWYRAWEMMRDVLDSRNAGPLFSKVMENTATDEDRSVIYLASLQRNASPDLKKSAAAQITNAYVQGGTDATE